MTSQALIDSIFHLKPAPETRRAVIYWTRMGSSGSNPMDVPMHLSRDPQAVRAWAVHQLPYVSLEPTDIKQINWIDTAEVFSFP